MFVINGRPTYAGGRFRGDWRIDLSPTHSVIAQGSNWIPTDQILPMIEQERYTRLLEMAASLLNEAWLLTLHS